MMRIRALLIFACLFFNLSTAMAGVELDLWDAIGDGDTETVKTILHNHPRLDLLGPKMQVALNATPGHTVLHLAAVTKKEVVELLLSFNPKITPRLLVAKSSEGETPLHWAVSQGKTEIVDLLLSFDPRLAKKLIAEKDLNETTPLFWASNDEKAEIVKRILDFDHELAKSLVLAKSKTGRNPLHAAASNKGTEVADLLLSFDPQIARQLLTAKDSQDRTPLHVASTEGRAEIVKIFLEYDRELASDFILARDRMGRTPLHAAASNGHARVISALLEFNSSKEFTEITDSSGNSALGSAIVFGRSAVVSVFVRNGASLDDVAIQGVKTSALEFLNKEAAYKGWGRNTIRDRLGLRQNIVTKRIESQPAMDW